MKLRRYTDVVCQNPDCGFKYTLPTNSPDRLELMLVYTICPQCHEPRTSQGNPNVPHCSECHLPETIIRILPTEGLCINCHYVFKRNRKHIMGFVE